MDSRPPTPFPFIEMDTEDEWSSAVLLMEIDPGIIDITIRKNERECLQLIRLDGYGIVRMHTIY